MTDDREALAAAGDVVRGPTLRQGALVTILGYLLSFGTPFASFYALPRLLVATSAAGTSENLRAHPGLFAAAIFAMLGNFVGDVLSAWGMYVLLRSVNAAWSMLAAWLRLVYTAAGVAAVANLVTAHRLVTSPDSLAALGATSLDGHVLVALRAFQAQFDFSLILFGAYLLLVGGLVARSGYIPRWLGVVLVVDGLGWLVMQSAPYFLPHVDLGFLFVATLGELVFLVWLVGWGVRLKEPA
jgi:Domain of unknown function (DUF4386)